MASFFTYGTNVDSLLTTTLSTWADKKMVLNTFNQTPVLERLMTKKKTLDGGASILVPVTYEANSTVKSFSDFDVLDTTPQQGMLSLQAKWKNIAGAVSVSGTEVRQNSGKAKVIDLVKAKMEQLEASFKASLTTQLFAASTGSKDIQSIPTIFDATTSIQDLAVTSSWWAGSTTASGSFAARGLSDMRTLYSTISVLLPDATVDTIITTPTIHNYYEGSLIQNQRYSVADKTGNASFEYLKFKTCDMIQDTSATSGTLYMFPSELLELYVHSSADMVDSEWRVPFNQDARTKFIFLMAQLVVKSRRKMGSLTGITA